MTDGECLIMYCIIVVDNIKQGVSRHKILIKRAAKVFWLDVTI